MLDVEGDAVVVVVVVAVVALADGTADEAVRERRRRAEARSVADDDDDDDGCGRRRRGAVSLVATSACWRPPAACGVEARISHLSRARALLFRSKERGRDETAKEVLKKINEASQSNSRKRVFQNLPPTSLVSNS